MEIIDYRRGDAKGGILVNGKDQYIAVTELTSKKFKSLRGAQKFLESYGYRPVKGNETKSIGGKRDVWEFVKENRDGAVHFLRLIKIRYTDGSPIYKSEFYDQEGHKLALRFDSFEEAEETLQRLGYRLKNWSSYPFEVEFMDQREWVPPLTAEVRKQAGRLLASRKKSSIGKSRSSRKPLVRGFHDEWYVVIEKNLPRRTSRMIDYDYGEENMYDNVVMKILDWAYDNNDKDLIKSLNNIKTTKDFVKRTGSKIPYGYSTDIYGDKEWEILEVTKANFEELGEEYPDIYDRFKDDFLDEDDDY